MDRLLRGGSLALLVFALLSCSTEQSSPTGEEARPAPEEVTKEVTKVVTVAEAPKPARDAPTDPAPSSAPATPAASAEAPAAQEESPEDVLVLQYNLLNEGDYEGAYALFDEASKQATSSDQYRGYFESLAPYSIMDYSFLSVDLQGDTATVEAALTASSAEGEESYQVTQELVREGGSWRPVMREEQLVAFAPAGQETAQYDESEQAAAPTPASGNSGSVALSDSGSTATEKFDLEAGLAVLSMTYQGQGNFVVDLLDKSGTEVGYAIGNEIGSGKVSNALQIPAAGSYLLDVNAEGPWTVDIEQSVPAEAPETTSFSGNNNAATPFFFASSGLKTVSATYQGEGNFVVDLLDSEGSIVEYAPVNEIGTGESSTTVQVPDDGIYLFNVQADGPWTLQVE